MSEASPAVRSSFRPTVLALALLIAAPAKAEVLFEKSSLFGSVTVEESDGIRQLLVDGVPQTSIRVGDPSQLVHEYVRLSIGALAFVPKPSRVLVIGLGGGAIPNFLRWRDPSVTIDAVDIDPVVVEAARKFFDVREDKRLRIHIGDAKKFLEGSRSKWDIIFIDAYAGEEVPEHLATAEFLKLVRSKLTIKTKGVVASNVWGPPSPQYRRLYEAHLAAFPELVVVEGREDANHIFFGAASPPTCDELVAAAKALPKIPFPLADAMREGCSRAPEPAVLP